MSEEVKVWECMYLSTASLRTFISVHDGIIKLWLPGLVDPVIVPNDSSVCLDITSKAFVVHPISLTVVREPPKQDTGGWVCDWV